MNAKDTTEVFHGNNAVFITGGKIPSWAMLGNASLTINIYDRPPELGGQPTVRRFLKPLELLFRRT